MLVFIESVSQLFVGCRNTIKLRRSHSNKAKFNQVHRWVLSDWLCTGSTNIPLNPVMWELNLFFSPAKIPKGFSLALCVTFAPVSLIIFFLFFCFSIPIPIFPPVPKHGHTIYLSSTTPFTIYRPILHSFPQ